jgi:hypothetical protein
VLTFDDWRGARWCLLSSSVIVAVLVKQEEELTAGVKLRSLSLHDSAKVEGIQVAVELLEEWNLEFIALPFDK